MLKRKWSQKIGPMETFTARLNHALTVRGLTRYKLSKKTGVSESHLKRLVDGDQGQRISDEMVRKLAAGLGVRSDWLSVGEGPMEPDVAAPKPPSRLRDRPEWTMIAGATRAQRPDLTAEDVDAVGFAFDDDVLLPSLLDPPLVAGLADVLRSFRARRKTSGN